MCNFLSKFLQMIALLGLNWEAFPIDNTVEWNVSHCERAQNI